MVVIPDWRKVECVVY